MQHSDRLRQPQRNGCICDECDCSYVAPANDDRCEQCAAGRHRITIGEPDWHQHVAPLPENWR